MAKTQYSFSHDPKLKGVPRGEIFLNLPGIWTLISFRIHNTYSRRAPFGWCWVLVPHPGRDKHHARFRNATVCVLLCVMVVSTDDKIVVSGKLISMLRVEESLGYSDCAHGRRNVLTIQPEFPSRHGALCRSTLSPYQAKMSYKVLSHAYQNKRGRFAKDRKLYIYPGNCRQKCSHVYFQAGPTRNFLRPGGLAPGNSRC